MTDMPEREPLRVPPSPEQPRQLPERLGFSSLALHAGERLPIPAVHPIAAPIYTTVGFEAESAAALDEIFAGVRSGYNYSRHGNPTSAAFEAAVARLEGGAAAVAFASGMAALHGAFLAAEVRAGDTIVSSRDIYGATRSLFRDVFDALGVPTRYVSLDDLAAVETVVREVRPRVMFVETVSNPLLRVANVPAVIELARSAQASVIVDSTFTTPRLLRPIQMGADFVVHSATKYLSGHGDVTGGIVVCRNQEDSARLRHVARLAGGVLGPFEAYLAHRGLKTLGLRLTHQCRSARLVAERLASHPAIARVHYPGLDTHADHALATSLFSDGLYGAVVSIELENAGRAEVFRFMDALRLCCVAPTVGDVYSQLLYPAIASHRDLTPGERERAGIGENLVRLSVGIEDVEDLIVDVEHALGAI